MTRVAEIMGYPTWHALAKVKAGFVDSLEDYMGLTVLQSPYPLPFDLPESYALIVKERFPVPEYTTVYSQADFMFFFSEAHKTQFLMSYASKGLELNSKCRVLPTSSTIVNIHSSEWVGVLQPDSPDSFEVMHRFASIGRHASNFVLFVYGDKYKDALNLSYGETIRVVDLTSKDRFDPEAAVKYTLVLDQESTSPVVRHNEEAKYFVNCFRYADVILGGASPATFRDMLQAADSINSEIYDPLLRDMLV